MQSAQVESTAPIIRKGKSSVSYLQYSWYSELIKDFNKCKNFFFKILNNLWFAHDTVPNFKKYTVAVIELCCYNRWREYLISTYIQYQCTWSKRYIWRYNIWRNHLSVIDFSSFPLLAVQGSCSISVSWFLHHLMLPS